MRLRKMLAITLVMPVTILSAQIFPGLEGQELIDKLVDEYKANSVLDYGEARDTMYAIIDNDNDSVRCVYTKHSLFLPTGIDPSQHLFMNGMSDGINAEHTWPRSKGASEDNGNPYSDLHHIFPARAAVNESRSNFPFTNIADVNTQKWFYLNQETTSIPLADIDEYSERQNGWFEPREDHKGNVARAMLYFYTMYQAEADGADPNYFPIQQEKLCLWHQLDPADKLEKNRTWQIAGYQDGLPNPFVLDCTLAERTYCGDYPSECPVVNIVEQDFFKTDLLITPNPADTQIELDGIKQETPFSLKIMNVQGIIFKAEKYCKGQNVNVQELPFGLYFIILSNRFKVLQGQFIKI